MKTVILGTGSFAPEKILTNFDLEKIVDTTDEWIRTRSGIIERHIVEDGTLNSDIALEAAKRALEAAKISPQDLDAILVGTVTPDYVFPSTACILQKKLGAARCMAFDFEAGCTGFVYGSILANSLITSGTARHVLVIGVDLLTRITNWKDRSTCVLFGDGAGAVVYGASPSDDKGILSSYAASDGSLGELLIMPAGGTAKPPSHETVDANEHTIVMFGNEVFKHAVRMMEEAVLNAVERAGISLSQVNWLIPHQANIRIIDFIARRLNMPMEKVIVTIDKYGNTSAASIPISLNCAIRDGRIKQGDVVVMVAFGAGFTWGALTIKI